MQRPTCLPQGIWQTVSSPRFTSLPGGIRKTTVIKSNLTPVHGCSSIFVTNRSFLSFPLPHQSHSHSSITAHRSNHCSPLTAQQRSRSRQNNSISTVYKSRRSFNIGQPL
ncbi:hypothetical protein PGT21_005022 [Puccinia graminis f. sp. tritici]|uniref:Uncharacterized protein n=1 Tax=Puccinia graminis f. sp. tritici TaxID=56615 RepID=A0A5B0SEE2_PUCGR|nr:hypothetical protein PGT21_005022 [Puccinia graminis f. sp. tritici]KAA1135573.1 hypothetical protein PGTUg99_021387 [Puccinia graminis f. sp. tritici]